MTLSEKLDIIMAVLGDFYAILIELGPLVGLKVTMPEKLQEWQRLQEEEE